MTAPASPVELPQLPDVPRYKFDYDGNQHSLFPNKDGAFVLWSDVEQMRAWGQQCYEAGVRAERERCAKLCEGVAREYESYTVHDDWPDPELVTDKCAAAIRKGE